MDLIRVLAYDFWANGESLLSLRAGGSPRLAVGTFAHIVAMHEFWLSRIGGREERQAWPEYDLDTASTHLNIAFKRWSGILTRSEQSPPGAEFEYSTGNGMRATNTYQDIVLELALHGAHHRGQIALILRQTGYEPPRTTDFIPALRTGKF